MPCVACRSRIRATSDHCSLTLSVRHRLVAGYPSNTVHSLGMTRFPDDVDVLLASDIVITLTGVSDGMKISAEEVYTSALSQHLVNYFQTNAAELGLNTVSKLHIDEEDGLPKVVLTSSRQIPEIPEIHPVRLLLVAIDLCYSWQAPKSLQAEADRASHPFSARLSLPYKTLLDNVVGRFVTWQLVKRYPLIFGPWCQQLGVESSYFPGIFGSIVRVMERSPNAAFRARCRHLIKILRGRRLSVLSDASSSLSTYLASIEEDGVAPSKSLWPDITDEDAICFALEKVYRNGLSRPQFKGLVNATNADRADDEDLSQEHTALTADEPMTRPHEDLLWDDTSKDALESKRSLSPSIYAWFLDMPSEGENGFDNDKALDYDPNHWSENDLIERDWSGDELLALERPHEPEEHCFRLAHGIADTNPVDTFHDIEYVSLPPVLDFEDGDVCLDPSLGSSRTEYLVPEGPDPGSALSQNIYDHVICESDSTDQRSQDTAGRMFQLGDRSHATCSLAYLRSPSISGLPSNQEGADVSEKQITRTLYWPRLRTHTTAPEDIHEGDNFNTSAEENTAQTLVTFSHGALNNGEDLDLDMISDTGSSISIQRETTLEKNRDLDQYRGVSVAIAARPDFPEARNPNVSPTLVITCPQQTNWHRQLRDSQVDVEDSDEELWRGESIGDSPRITCFGEDVLAVIDFGHDAP